MLARPTPRKVWFLASAVVLGAIAGAARIESAPASAPDMSGTWTLNRDLSEFPREVGFGVDLPTGIGVDGEHSGGGGRGGRRGGGAGSPIPNRIPPPQSEEDVAKADQLVDEVKSPAASLVIAQIEGGVAITNAEGRTRRFHTNGKQEIQTLNAGPVTSTAKWRGAQLVIQYDVDRERQLRYTFERGSDRSQLRVQAQLLMHGRGETITRVYGLALAAL